IFFFFFFQAEDGIRDYKVTGVQRCALPISYAAIMPAPRSSRFPGRRRYTWYINRNGTSYGVRRVRESSKASHPWRPVGGPTRSRSEERRVGKECRSRGSPEH